MLLMRITIVMLLGTAALQAQGLETGFPAEALPASATNAAVLRFTDRGWLPGAPMRRALGSGEVEVARPGSSQPAGLLPRTVVDMSPLAVRRMPNPDTLKLTALPNGQASGQNPLPRRRAVTYSDAYLLRRKIHKYASFATVPLFISEIAVGQKLFHGGGSESLRSVHSGLAAGIAVLFGVNSVTGVWNLWEGRKDPNGRGKRMFHGILMLAADAGFVATGALAPGEHEDGRWGTSGDRRSAHRTVAFTSMGVAAFGYLYMWLAR
jgi:hypothetical protein